MVLVVQVVSSPASAAKAADMYVQRSTASEEDLSCIAAVFFVGDWYVFQWSMSSQKEGVAISNWANACKRAGPLPIYTHRCFRGRSQLPVLYLAS